MKTKIDLKKKTYGLWLTAAWGAGFLVLAACYFMLHLPQKDKLAKVRRQYAESQEMVLIARKAAQPDVRDRLQQRFEDAGQAVRHFSVPQEKTTGLVFEIGKIANDVGLSAFSSKNQPIRDFSTLGESQQVTEASLKVEFASSFLKLAEFINRLERQTPAVFVEQMTLRRNEEGGAEHRVRMDLSFMVTHNQSQSVAAAN
jgi:hypothetical protein